MEIYRKNGITVDLFGDDIIIRDATNAGFISCPCDNVTTLLNELRGIKQAPEIYKHQNCLNGYEFFPTIGCEGNYIRLSHMTRIITAIRGGRKISFNLKELSFLNLKILNDINMCLSNGNCIIRGDIIDIILYNINSNKKESEVKDERSCSKS